MLQLARVITTKPPPHLTELLTGGLSGDPARLEETARLILSTATSASSSVSVNYLIPLLLLASQSVGPSQPSPADNPLLSVPVGYFVFRLGLFSLDDTLGATSGVDFAGYNAPAAYGAPASSYNAPAPSYNAPAPSYNAPAPSYNAPAAAPSYNSPSPSYNSNSVSSSLTIPNSGAYLTSKEDDQVR